MSLKQSILKKQEDLQNSVQSDSRSFGATSGSTLYRTMPLSDSGRRGQDWDPISSRMSPARRTFCLVTTFDLILTFILWVIYTQLIGITPIWTAFKDQVFNYTFQKSLFDTVMISTARFTFIMLAYALFRISHWWVIAVSTLMTCVYLLCKCFLFEFNDSVLGGKNPLSYVLLIVCFVLAWVETWFLDFKVLPREKAHLRDDVPDPEREGLLPSGGRRYASTQSIEDTREYYSPFHTPEGSEDEGEHHHHSGHHHPGHHKGSLSSTHIRKEVENCNQLLAEAKEAFIEMFHMDGWKLENGKSLEEGFIYSQNIKKYGRKIFKLQGIIDMAPQDLWQDMVSTLNESPKWNPTILESRVIDDCTEITYNIAAEGGGGLVSARDFVSIRQWTCYNNEMFISVSTGTTHTDMPPQKKYVSLQVINDNTEVTYNLTAEAGGGLVSSRDFVNIRQWLQLEPGVFISYGTGCIHPDMPVQKKYVRGDNGPGGWIFEPVEEEPDKCLFTWIVNTNLKGWLPQAAIDQAMSGVLVSYFKLLVKHYEEVIEERTPGL